MSVFMEQKDKEIITENREGSEDNDKPESDIEDENEEDSQPQKVKVELAPSDFYFGKTLGEGAFARVMHCKSKTTSAEFAVKIMEKLHIKRENKVQQVMMERAILTIVNHPFIIKFHFSFQDTEYLYMCLDLVHGGELLSLINHDLDENVAAGVEGEACSYKTTVFYVSEIVEAIQYLHDNQIIHRDLKPENILISRDGHIKVTDFGSAVKYDHNDDNIAQRTSFVGTQDYVSPEVLSGDRNATKACDLWALGCMIFQMRTGVSPFRRATEYLTFEAIMGHCKGNAPLEIPSSIQEDTRDIIEKLLIAEDGERLGAGDDVEGANGYDMLKSHPFFSGVPWGSLVDRNAPYIPDAAGFPDGDVQAMHDGADDEWRYDGDPTPILSKGAMHSVDGGDEGSEGEAGSSNYSSFADQMQLMAGIKGKRNSTVWSKFLQEGEKQIYCGLISKRRGLFSKRRQLLLTDKPRLLYVDPDTMEKKGEIPWTDDKPVACHIKNLREFDVYCSASGRFYHICDSEAGSQIWFDLINAMLQVQSERRTSQAIPVVHI